MSERGVASRRAKICDLPDEMARFGPAYGLTFGNATMGSQAPESHPPGGWQHGSLGEDCLRRFIAALHAGESPHITDYLPDGPGRPGVLIQLISAEVEGRIGRGERVDVGDYVRRFPELAAHSATAMQSLHAAAECGPRGLPFDRETSSLADAATGCQGEQPQSGDIIPTLMQPPVTGLLPAEFVRLLSPPEDPGELGRVGGYTVLSLLGRGGMGAVLAAVDARLGRMVALKVMLPAIAVQPGARDRFLREARAAAALRGDHVVPIYHVGDESRADGRGPRRPGSP